MHSADAGGGTGAGLPDNIVDADALSAAVAEPLTESAPIAFETAHALCPVDEAGGCRSYHAVWQYLRIAGLVRAMQSDGPLYVSAVMRLARERRLGRVLICGAADYSSLAYLAYGTRQAGVAPCFDVIDLCETPLRMVGWYGARSGIAVNPICADATAFDSPHRYDLICAHSLLAAMPHASRPGLFAMWRRLLAPHGRICFSSRINREAAGAERASEESRVEAMTREFFQRRDALDLKLPMADGAFSALIRRYANRGLGRRQGITRAMIRDWCKGQGLALAAELETASIVPNARDRSSLPLESGTHARWWFEARHA